jgi:hypothetical protein
MIKAYHGARSAAGIRIFKDQINWFSETPGLANIYAMNSRDSYDARSSISIVHLSIIRPLDFVALGITADDYLTKKSLFEQLGFPVPVNCSSMPREVKDTINAPDFIGAAKLAGFDGFKILEHDSSGDQIRLGRQHATTWAAFESHQIHPLFARPDLRQRRPGRAPLAADYRTP